MRRLRRVVANEGSRASQAEVRSEFSGLPKLAVWRAVIRVLLLHCLCVVSLGYVSPARASAEVLVLRLPVEAPLDFDRKRLQEKIELYLAELNQQVDLQMAGPDLAGSVLVLELNWTKESPKALDATLIDRAQKPARSYQFRVDFIEPREAFERLTALKVRSALRQVFEDRAVVEPAQPPRAWFAHLGALSELTDAELDPAFGVDLGIGTEMDDWQFLACGFANLGDRTSERYVVLWGGRAWVRYLLPVGSSFRLSVGPGFGIRVAQIRSELEGLTRSASLVSPTLSLGTGLDYAIGSTWSMGLGPRIDWILDRADLTNAGSVIFDMGRAVFGAHVTAHARF